MMNVPGAKSTKKKESAQLKNLRNVYNFKDEEKKDAIKSVQQISQNALRSALVAEETTRSVVFSCDMLEAAATLISFNSQSSIVSREEAIFRGMKRGSIEENENVSSSLRSHDTDGINYATGRLMEDPLSALSGVRKPTKTRKNIKSKSPARFPQRIPLRKKTLHKNDRRGNQNMVASSSPPSSSSNEVWMCGVSAKTFSSFEAARRQEQYLIKEIVNDFGWHNNSLLNLNTNDNGSSHDLLMFQSASEGTQTDSFENNDQLLERNSDTNQNLLITSNVSSPPIRLDALTVSKSSRYLSTRNVYQTSMMHKSKATSLNITNSTEYSDHIVSLDIDDPINYHTDGYVVFADEALADVSLKAEKICLSQLEQEAEFELECYSKDKHYYDMLEQRGIERQKEGSYSRFRTDGKNFSEKIQNKFVDAYAVMKQGKSKKTMASVDHYKRKLDGDLDVRNEIGNTKQTLYVNVIVKNSIQVVSHELDRLARARWEEHKKNEGGTDLRNEESRTQFEKFKAAAQGQLVQLAGLALASDFTPRRIAVQLSNDLYR